MPQVVLTCKDAWKPRHHDSLAYRLGAALPELFFLNAGPLQLDYDTYSGDVQVQFKDFGPMDINIPDIWVKVTFTEDPSGKTPAELHAIRDNVRVLLVAWLESLPASSIWPQLTIDVFWGPSHGAMLTHMGVVVKDW